jgi:hypothetical protein
MPNLVVWKISGLEHDQQTIGKIWWIAEHTVYTVLHMILNDALAG